MSLLTVVGLGPGDPGLRTVACQRELDRASRIVLRTAIHPGVEDIASDPRTVACDDLYGSADNFDLLYGRIAERTAGLLGAGDVVYAVPGSPASGESSVGRVRRLAEAEGHAVHVVAGVGALDLVAATAGLDLMSDSVQIVDATLLAEWVDAQPFGGWLLPVVPSRPIIVTQVYSADMRSAVSAALGSLYADEQAVSVVGWDEASGTPSRRDTTLLELDRVAVDHLTSIVVYAVESRYAPRSPFALDRVISHLRSPEGCPWDREQTHASLMPKIVEEAFEVVDAVAEDEGAALADELGDALLQPVINAQIAAEDGRFDLPDVFEAVTEKLIRRHPHVFGEERAETADQVLTTWRRVKAAEGGKPKPANPYDRLPRSMPPSLKVARTLPRGDDVLGEGEAAALARAAADALVRLTAAGYDADGLVDAECRILVDRALAAESRTGKG